MKVLFKRFHLNGRTFTDLKVKTTLYSEINSSAMCLFKKLWHISFSVKTRKRSCIIRKLNETYLEVDV